MKEWIVMIEELSNILFEVGLRERIYGVIMVKV